MNYQVNVKLNLTDELSKLLMFTGNVALDIRNISKDDVNTPYYVMELGDALHNFNQLGRFIIKNDGPNIIKLCDYLITDYRRFLLEDNKRMQDLLKKTGFKPQVAIEIFREIKEKVEQFITASK